MSADIRVTSVPTAPADVAGTFRWVPLTSLRSSYAELRPGALPERARPAAVADLPVRVVLSPAGDMMLEFSEPNDGYSGPFNARVPWQSSRTVTWSSPKQATSAWSLCAAHCCHVGGCGSLS